MKVGHSALEGLWIGFQTCGGNLSVVRGPHVELPNRATLWYYKIRYYTSAVVDNVGMAQTGVGAPGGGLLKDRTLDY